MGGVPSAFSCAGTCWHMEISIFRLPATVYCHMAITVDTCVRLGDYHVGHWPTF